MRVCCRFCFVVDDFSFHHCFFYTDALAFKDAFEDSIAKNAKLMGAKKEGEEKKEEEKEEKKEEEKKEDEEKKN